MELRIGLEIPEQRSNFKPKQGSSVVSPSPTHNKPNKACLNTPIWLESKSSTTCTSQYQTLKLSPWFRPKGVEAGVFCLMLSIGARLIQWPLQDLQEIGKGVKKFMNLVKTTESRIFLFSKSKNVYNRINGDFSWWTRINWKEHLFQRQSKTLLDVQVQGWQQLLADRQKQCYVQPLGLWQWN